jgi:hypothetical protein
MTKALYNHNSMQAYINYLKNVLGIKQVLQGSEPQPLKPRIAIWVENLEKFSDADRALFNNMISAMKIPASDMQVRDLSLKSSETFPIEFELVMNPDPAKPQTFSPQMLHEQKQLKAQVWTFLQMIMHKYSSLN